MSEGVAGLILAGGHGSRLGGRNKALIPLGGRPLVAHVAERIAGKVSSLAVSANDDTAVIEALGFTVVADASKKRHGPLAGLLAGMDWAAAQGGAHSIVSVAVDTPFVPPDLVERLTARANQQPGFIVLAASEGAMHPTAGLWPVALREPLRRHLATTDRRRVREWAEAQGLVTVAFEPLRTATRTVDPFFNINTPEDLAEAEALQLEIAAR